jgi:hypothetical protein
MTAVVIAEKKYITGPSWMMNPLFERDAAWQTLLEFPWRGKTFITYNRDAEQLDREMMRLRTRMDPKIWVLTVCCTNLARNIRQYKEIDEHVLGLLTPGRPCLTGLYEHENSAR